MMTKAEILQSQLGSYSIWYIESQAVFSEFVPCTTMTKAEILKSQHGERRLYCHWYDLTRIDFDVITDTTLTDIYHGQA